MALRDFTIYDENGFGFSGSEPFAVAAGATAILSGEPVAKALAGTTVTQLATNKPVVGTDYLAGIACSNSTQTASVAGTVQVIPIDAPVTYLVAPKVAATWDTQAEYDALVGSRVLIDLTTGTFTALAADGATYGCVVEPLDITKYPGKVRVSFRKALSYKA